MPWSEQSFALARSENKPVFLSIGYSTCHWCHVMAHESFENPATAEILNREFVSIKVDREERPDVDRLYMAFVQATTGSGGWPMSVWLTPDGEPFYGGTYFPPEDRYGRAGFPRVLEAIAQTWKTKEQEVRGQATNALSALAELHPANFSGLPEGLAVRTVEDFSRGFDATHGGFGGAPKFPRPSVFTFLMRTKEGGTRPHEMTFRTLRMMCAGGVRDQLGGGFHRYSVDRFWHVPHFEKMLYDQAQMAVALTEAWQATKDETFRKAAMDTLDYVLRDLSHPEGGFYSAEDADSVLAHDSTAHAEGAFYVWTREEVEKLLPPEDFAALCLHFSVFPDGNAPDGSDPQGEFDGKNILHQNGTLRDSASALKMEPEFLLASLERSRSALLAARNKRPRPHLDDKILTAWNGLAISAFAKAGAAFSEPRYVEAASRAAKFVNEKLLDSKTGELRRSWRGHCSGIPAFCEDYAFLIAGLLDLYQVNADACLLTRALALQKAQEAAFADEKSGGYFLNRAGDPLLPVRVKGDHDGAEPLADSVSAWNLLTLSRLTHNPDFEKRAQEIFRAWAAAMEQSPTAFPCMLSALGYSETPPRQAIVTGPFLDSAKLRHALHQDFHPGLIVIHAEAAIPEMESPTLVSLHGHRTAVLICKDFACQTPSLTPEDVRAALEEGE